jgi:5-formyltetrahydrofolate cyclo-ligase
MSKSKLRDRLKQVRQQLSDTDREVFSRIICQQLEIIDWSGTRALHCFRPIKDLQEVDITDFIAWVQVTYPQIQIYTSACIANKWQIVTWEGQIVTKKPQFDVVVIPMLGFDQRLHRIGYGGGYYDKFLANQPQARKIGVCFEQCKVAHIPIELHDIALDSIITQANTY